MTSFDTAIAQALGHDLTPPPAEVTGTGNLPSYFDVTGLTLSSVAAAAAELGAVLGAPAQVNRRHALQWFDMTVRPDGWDLPSVWDAVAGDYATRDGWIRLHTNAPHHREAALSVLDCAAERETVAQIVSDWRAAELEAAIVEAGGCAAELRGLNDWAAHPQGKAVAAEPLIAWAQIGEVPTHSSPLTGLRILDLTRVLAGPVATRCLAGFGATVLRIDPPGWNEPAVEQEVTLGKRCAGLDLWAEDDRATFSALLREADVLVHGYRAGALEGLGFGSDARRALNPALIDVSLNAYGWTGPWRGRRGFDSLVQMSSGIAAEGMVRAGRDRPVPLPVQALDHATGYLLAAALLRALRLRNSKGQVMQARLSLARTARLLVSAGTSAISPALEPETQDDLAPEVENTGWGPAKRIKFPITIGGSAPDWPLPTGPLRRHRASWD